MKFIAALVFSMCAFAQTEVSLTPFDEGPAVQVIYAYTGSNIISACYAYSTITSGRRASTFVSISAATNANPVVFTSTGHGFNTNSRPNVTISGGTGNWTATNGTFVATVIDANTFSVPVNSTSLGALTGTVVFSTSAPRQTVAEWAVIRYFYDGSNNILSKVWLSGSSAFNVKCSDSASTTNQIQ